MRRYCLSMLAASLLLSAGVGPALAVSQEAFAHNKSGIALAKQGKFQEAIAEIKKAEALEPNNADYHNNLSSLYTVLKEPGEALKEARLAVKVKPNEARSNLNLGNLALAQKDYATAQKAFSVVLKSQPKNADALLGLTQALVALKKLPEAEKEGRLTVATTKGAGNPEAHLLLADILKEERKYKDAIAQYQTVLNLDPNHPQAQAVQDQINYLKTQTEPIHK